MYLELWWVGLLWFCCGFGVVLFSLYMGGFVLGFGFGWVCCCLFWIGCWAWVVCFLSLVACVLDCEFAVLVGLVVVRWFVVVLFVFMFVLWFGIWILVGGFGFGVGLGGFWVFV